MKIKSMRIKVLGVGIFILAIFIFALLNFEKGKNVERSRKQQESAKTPTLIPAPKPLNGETIIFTGLKFTPETLTISKGKVVNFANFGDNPINISSEDQSEQGKKLSVGVVKSGETSNFVEFDETGIYKYVDSNNPQNSYHRGTIIVK